VSVLSTGLPDYESHVAKPLTVTVATAKKLSGLGNTTIWALIKDRTLETVHVGRRRLITYRSLEALLTPCLTPQARPRRERGRPRKIATREGATP
jgi:excisionase family DNA binding protein